MTGCSLRRLQERTVPASTHCPYEARHTVRDEEVGTREQPVRAPIQHSGATTGCSPRLQAPSRGLRIKTFVNVSFGAALKVRERGNEDPGGVHRTVPISRSGGLWPRMAAGVEGGSWK